MASKRLHEPWQSMLVALDRELRPKLGRPQREDLTLRLRIEIIEEIRGGA